jgi:hypothetical protein
MSDTHSVARHPAGPSGVAEGGNRRAGLALPAIATAWDHAGVGAQPPDAQWEMS